MTATVRLFTHSGLISLPIASYSGQHSENAAFALKQPYLGNETMTVTETAQLSSSTLSASEHVRLLRVEVQQGKVVHFELTPKGQETRVATTDSPTLRGRDQLEFGPGWTISLREGSE